MIKDVIVKDAGKKGKGVFALRSFKKGEFIFRGKKGKIVHKKELPKLSKWELRHLCEIDRDTFEIETAPGCYINHSCDPNAVSKGCGVYALKSIKKGQEITVDYRITGLFNNRWKCYCGSKNCTGWVTSNFLYSFGKTTEKISSLHYKRYSIGVLQASQKKGEHRIYYMRR